MANPFDVAADHQWRTSSAFRGAEVTRLYADTWSATNHPDNEIQYAARPLRARARDLVRNNPYAAGVVEAFCDNLIGWEGITLKPRITDPPNDPRGEPVREVNWEIERGWKEWGEEHATVDTIETWFETERLIIKSWVTDGEVFIRHRRGWDNPHGFAVELIDPDLLDEGFNERWEKDGREIVQGVEVDRHGRPVAYHFWTHHPDAMQRRQRVRIPAREITHLYTRYRAGQTRGYSLFAPILTTVEMIDGLTEAELVASRYHASKMGFITNQSPEAIAAYAQKLRLQNEGGKDAPSRRVKIGPGVVEELQPGQGFEGFDPNHPNDAFDPFLKTMLRGVARGFAMSYLTLTGDVGEANYSSMRAGLLPERDHWRVLQNVVSGRVHRPIYRDWIGSALLNGAVELPSPVPSDYYGVEWRGRRWQWVDPANDLEALEREIRLGINSRQRGASDRGLDYETVIDETAEDLEYARENGVDVSGMGTRTRPPEPQDTTAAQDGNGNGNGNGATGATLAGRLAPYRLEAPRGD